MAFRISASKLTIQLLRSVAIGVVPLVLLYVIFVSSTDIDGVPPPEALARAGVMHAKLAITAMASDSQCDLACLFNPDGVAARRSDLMQREGLDAFEASVRIYSTAFAALLNHGKDAEKAVVEPEGELVQGIFDPIALRRLGTSSMELREDPWGQPYHFFLGPWPMEWGPPVFRVYRNPAEKHVADALTVTTSEGARVGFPATSQLPVYIWSLGANGVSDQARFDPSGTYAGAPRDHYRADATEQELGGGDDISNWDTETSWEPFYPRPNKFFGCRR